MFVWMAALGLLVPRATTFQNTSSSDIPIRECLVIRSVGRSGRSAPHTDAIEGQIVSGKWSAPKSGDHLALPDGRSQTWTEAKADKDGWISNQALNGGYAFAQLDSP